MTHFTAALHNMVISKVRTSGIAEATHLRGEVEILVLRKQARGSPQGRGRTPSFRRIDWSDAGIGEETTLLRALSGSACALRRNRVGMVSS
jgi:hypothetical protein